VLPLSNKEKGRIEKKRGKFEERIALEESTNMQSPHSLENNAHRIQTPFQLLLLSSGLEV